MRFNRISSFAERIVPSVFYKGIFLFVLSGFSACSNTPQSEAKRIIKEQVALSSQGHLEMTNFREIDAVEQEYNGMPIYQLTYEVEVKAVKEGGWVDVSDGILGSKSKAFSLEAKSSSFAVNQEQCAYDYSFITPSWECKNTQLKKGDTYKAHGHLYLEKHEQGWVTH